MCLYVVRFFDSEVGGIRRQYLQAHLDWLDARRDSVLVAVH